MKVEEFLEKAKDMVGMSGVDLMITKTSDAITYDGIHWFKNVLSFDVMCEDTRLLTIYLDEKGDLKKAEWSNTQDKAYAMAQAAILNKIFKGQYFFKVKDKKHI